MVIVRNVGSTVDALRLTVGRAAKLAICEGDVLLRFGTWQENTLFHLAVASPMRPDDQAGVEEP
jgi:hypothetical protein